MEPTKINELKSNVRDTKLEIDKRINALDELLSNGIAVDPDPGKDQDPGTGEQDNDAPKTSVDRIKAGLQARMGGKAA